MMTVSLTLKQAMRIIARKLPELRDDEYVIKDHHYHGNDNLKIVVMMTI